MCQHASRRSGAPLILALASLYLGCATPEATHGLSTGRADPAADAPPERQRCGHHLGGDRVGTHGMVLFGRDAHFLAHIPVFARPHNEQLVMRVTVRDASGLRLEAATGADFSTGAFSIRPTRPFSLDELATGALVRFAADVHEGNFEHGGPVIISDADVTVDEVIIARNLPVPGTPDPGQGEIEGEMQEYFLVGSPDDAYLVNYIRQDRPWQHILRLAQVSGVHVTPRGTTRIKIPSASRLAAAEPVSGFVPAAGAAAGTDIWLDIAAELWCLRGPDFFQPCE